MLPIPKSTFRVNRDPIDWTFVVRSSAGVALALLAGLRLGSTLDALLAGMGAISVGFISLRGVYRTRAGAMLATSGGMALAAYLAALAAPSPIGIVLLMAASGYACGVISSLSESAGAIALNSTIALVIIGNLSIPAAQAHWVPAYVALGGLVQTALVVMFWPVGRHGAERRALHDAYADLATYAASLSSDGEVTMPAHESLRVVRQTLEDPQPFGRRSDLLALQTLADEAERIRASLAWLGATQPRGDTAMTSAASALLAELSDALAERRKPSAPQAWAAANDALPSHPQWQRVLGQVRAAWRSATVRADPAAPAAQTPDRRLVPHVEDWWPILRANLGIDSPFGRHGIRLAVVLAVAEIVYRSTHLERGYWIALTALLVLRPDFTATFARGIGRIAGTIGGALLASAVALITPRNPGWDVAVAIGFATLGYAAFSVNFALYTITITAYVVFMFSMVGLSETGAIVDRIVATLAGGALGMIAYAVWPTWQSPLTRESLAGLLDIDRQYARLVFGAYVRGERLDAAAIARLQNAAWDARAKIDASIERMLDEPSRTHELAPADALAVSASTQRLALANIAMRSSAAAVDRPVPQLEPFAQAVDAALAVIARALAEGRPADAYPDLRAEYVELERALAGRPEADALLGQCDLYVDSINTIAEVLSKPPNVLKPK